MCPGGIIAPAATSNDEIVVNGWSPSRRNNPFANSGVVVSLGEKDFVKYAKHGALSALRYQQEVEQVSYRAGGGNQKAPAQRMLDFVEMKHSATLPVCSYIPGVTPVVLDTILPVEISSSLREALKIFGKKMKPYYITMLFL